jgi:hypothetical protein
MRITEDRSFPAAMTWLVVVNGLSRKSDRSSCFDDTSTAKPTPFIGDEQNRFYSIDEACFSSRGLERCSSWPIIDSNTELLGLK